MDKFLVIPNCSDYNRGDQALTWETVNFAKDAGFNGEYFLLREDDKYSQSVSKGMKIFQPILKHPSRKFKNKNNINYNFSIKIKWGMAASADLLKSLFTLWVCKYNCCKLFINKDDIEAINLYKESKAVFVKGGEFLHAHGDITSSYYMYYQLYPIYLALRLKKPVYIMPNSMGPLDGLFVKSQMKIVLKKIKLLLSRESISTNYMKDVFNCDISQTADFGFYLKSDEKFPVKEYLKQNNVDVDSKKCIAITVRPYRFPEHADSEVLKENYVNGFVEFANYLIANSYYPVFVQHTLSENSHENDLLMINRIVSELKKDEFSVIADEDLNCAQIKSIYSQMYCTVGTRFHSDIFTLASGLPVIAIGYGNKTSGIMTDLGMSDYEIPIDKINGELLINKFKNLTKNYDSICEHLKNKMIEMQGERTKLVERMAKDKK